MASQQYLFFVWNNGKQVTNSKDLEAILKAVEVSSDGVANGFKITQGANGFDFNGKKLDNLADATASTQAATKGQMDTALGNKVNTSAIGAASGVCPLGSDTKVPSINLPSYVDDVLEYANLAAFPTNGAFGAYTGTPTGCTTPVTVTADNKGTAGNVTLTGNGVKTISVLISDWNTAHAGNTVALTTGDGDQVPENAVDVVLAGGVAQLSEQGKIYVALDSNKSYRTSGSAYIEVSPGPGSTDSVTEGSTNKYFHESSVRSTVLTGLSVETGGAVSAEDTLLVGMGKLEKRVALDDAKVSYSASTARSDLIGDAIADAETTKAPTQNAVYDALLGKAASDHNHDGSYSALGHNHDGSYSALGHAHAISDVTGLQTALDDKAVAADDYVSKTNKEGAEISIRKFVFGSADGQVQLAQANDSLGEGTWLGCVKAATIANDASGQIWRPGKGKVIGGFSGLTVGTPIYLSRSSAGGYTQSLAGFVAGEHVISLGKVESATELSFNPEYLFAFA